MIKNKQVKLGLPSKLVHIETKVVLKVFPPYTQFEMAVYNPSNARGVTTYSYNSYPHGIVHGKLGAKFAGYIT